MALTSINNKENVSHDVKESHRLEKLLSEQIARSRDALHEQERLEHDLLKKEEQVLQLQTSLKNAKQLNKQLSNKVRTEQSYYEQELEKWYAAERTWRQQVRESKQENQLLQDVLKSKEDLITILNGELEQCLGDLEGKNKQLEGIERGAHEVKLMMDNSDDGKILLASDSESENDDLEQLYRQESDTEDNGPSQAPVSITSELNTQLDQKHKLVQKYRFELRALKNEKTQLYNYVNKLLRNQPHPKQNDVLKEKLVKRKILRTVSTSADRKQVSQKKRVFSNVVSLKSYRSRKPLEVHNNSDDEEDGELMLERQVLEFSGTRPFALRQFQDLNPFYSILRHAAGKSDQVDLDVD